MYLADEFLEVGLGEVKLSINEDEECVGECKVDGHFVFLLLKDFKNIIFFFSLIKMSLVLNQHFDYLFKMLVIGNSSAGKSSMLLRFSDGVFSESFLPTIGVDFKIRTIEIAKSMIKLQVMIEKK